MISVYDVYVWRHGRLWKKVDDILADGGPQAARRAVSALRQRPGLGDHETLVAFDKYFVGQGNGPSGARLQVVKKVDRPITGPCVVYE